MKNKNKHLCVDCQTVVIVHCRRDKTDMNFLKMNLSSLLNYKQDVAHCSWTVLFVFAIKCTHIGVS